MQVINETVRLANIAPGIFRKVMKEVEIKGIIISFSFSLILYIYIYVYKLKNHTNT